MRDRAKLRFALFGFGYWGPNIARNIVSCDEAELSAIVDVSPQRRTVASELYPSSKIHHSIDDLDLGGIDAAVVATPASSHVALSTALLRSGIHVLVEKPLALKVADAVQLVNLAYERNRVLMVDHTYLFSDAVNLMNSLSKSGQLGQLIHFDSTRVNLGIFQPDTSVIWDLAVHDISILQYVTGLSPKSVSATAHSHISSKHPVVSSLSLQFDEDFFAHISVSWISPVKVRRVALTGTKGTVVFDDVASDEKIKIYDSGVDAVLESEGVRALLKYRLGDIAVPRLAGVEALRREIDHFVDCIIRAKEPVSSGKDSLMVLAVLEAAEESARSGGTPTNIRYVGR